MVAAHIRTADAAADGSMEDDRVEEVEEDSCTAECQPSVGRGRLDRDVARHWDCEEWTSEGQCIEAGSLSCSFARNLISKGALIEGLMVKMQRDDERKWERRSGWKGPTYLPFWLDGSPELATASTLVDWLGQQALYRPPDAIFRVKNFSLFTQVR